MSFCMKKNYGGILKRAIKDSGMTQKQIADRLGESQQNLSNWTNKNDISLYNFIRICEAININPADIIDFGPEEDDNSLTPEAKLFYKRLINAIMAMPIKKRVKFLKHLETALDLTSED